MDLQPFVTIAISRRFPKPVGGIVTVTYPIVFVHSP